MKSMTTTEESYQALIMQRGEYRIVRYEFAQAFQPEQEQP